jgi:1-acyl-sn-glycerol-3-phosphate acyltransferase
MRVLLSLIISLIVLFLLGAYSSFFKKSNLIENCYNSLYLISKYILGCKLEQKDSNLTLKNRVLIISNHPTTLDFIYIIHWAKKYGRVGDLRFIAKDTLGNIPILGKYIKNSQCLISRDYEKDKDSIIEFCKKLSVNPKYILVIFPEGTTLYPESKMKSMNFASSNSKPIFNNVLYPRHKGLELIIKNLVIEQVCDITLFYNDDKKCYKCNYDKDFLFDSYPKNGVIVVREVNIKNIQVENLEKFLEKTWKTKEVFMKKILESE